MNANIGHLFILPKAKGTVNHICFMRLYDCPFAICIFFYTSLYYDIFQQKAFYPTM